MKIFEALLRELGGTRAISMGAIGGVLLWVSSSQYVESVEARITAGGVQIRELQERVAKAEQVAAARDRYSDLSHEGLGNRIDRLERLHEGAHGAREYRGQ